MDNRIKAMNQWFWIVVFCLTGWTAQATHIVGGSLTYRCLGNDTFELVLTLYTDCLFGQADYDDPAWVGVFNDHGFIVDTIFMRLPTKIDTLDGDDPCFESIPNLCVRVTQYKEKIVLPLYGGGYFLAYQRCCRNGTIQNIIEPLKAGATYWTHIPEATLKSCNNAPVWLKNPPIFICVNEPLVFDHSAFDPDGDSLAYELITPFTGGEYLVNPKPTPPFGPKGGTYDTILWNPPYNLSNLMGGTPLTLDPVTGLIQAMPNTLGQFLIAVKVKEYRNGELIGETWRDFQYNVVPCKVTQAIIDLPDTTFCDEFFVQFKNGSSQAMDFLWDFGVNGDTSTAFEPSYTYPDTGFYTVTLIVSQGDFCRDTTSTTLFFQRNSIDQCMEVRVPICQDSILVEMADCSTDSVSPIISWAWTFATPDTLIHVNTPAWQQVLYAPANAIISLTVESYNGCVATVSDTITFDIIDPPPLVPDTVNLCYLEIANLNPNFDPDLVHTWTPDTFLLGSAGDPNPDILAFETTLYTVDYTDAEGLCHVQQEVLLTVIDDLPDVELVITIPQCVDTAVLSALIVPYPTDVTVSWEVTTEKDVFVGGGEGIEVVLTESQEVIVCAMISTDSCKTVQCDTIQVNLLPHLELADTLEICEGDTATLHPGGPAELIYAWSPFVFMDDPSLVSPKVWPPVSQWYHVEYTDTVGLCLVTDSIFVDVNDSTIMIDFTWEVLCDGQTVVFTNLSDDVVVEFSWDFGEPSTSSDTSTQVHPTWKYPGPGTYPVLLTTPDAHICPQNDSITKELILEEAVNEADFTYDFEQCGFPTVIQFNGSAFSTYGNVDGWQWTFGTLGTSNEQNPVVTITESMDLEVVLVVTWDNLCVDTVIKVISIEVYDLEIPDGFSLCYDSCTQLLPVAGPGWVFTWSPADWVDDIHSAQPVVCPDSSSGHLTVEVMLIQPGGDTCILRDTVLFEMHLCDWDCEDGVPPDVMSCLDSAWINVTNCDEELELIWLDTAGNVIGFGTTIYVPTNQWPFVVLKKSGPFGFMDFDTIYIFKLDYAVPVVASADPVVIFKGQSSQLFADAPTAISFSWTPPGTLDNPNIQDPVANPMDSLIYKVVVTDTFGCTGEDTVLVAVLDTICAFPYIFVPNTFTPNDDGLNDVLYVRGSYVDRLEFYVYNRWGELVFETRDKNIGWDGTYKGELLRTDVYGYYLKCICYGQEEYFTRGNVTLLRN